MKTKKYRWNVKTFLDNLTVLLLFMDLAFMTVSFFGAPFIKLSASQVMYNEAAATVVFVVLLIFITITNLIFKKK